MGYAPHPRQGMKQPNREGATMTRDEAIKKAYEDGYLAGQLESAKRIEELAIHIRDNGPKSAEGLLTAMAGAHVEALLDAAVSLRLIAARR